MSPPEETERGFRRDSRGRKCPYFKVVSAYQDGERVLESIWHTKKEAEADVQRVAAFRDDQDEGPSAIIVSVGP